MFAHTQVIAATPEWPNIFLRVVEEEIIEVVQNIASVDYVKEVALQLSPRLWSL